MIITTTAMYIEFFIAITSSKIFLYFDFAFRRLNAFRQEMQRNKKQDYAYKLQLKPIKWKYHQTQRHAKKPQYRDTACRAACCNCGYDNSNACASCCSVYFFHAFVIVINHCNAYAK